MLWERDNAMRPLNRKGRIEVGNVYGSDNNLWVQDKNNPHIFINVVTGEIKLLPKYSDKRYAPLIGKTENIALEAFIFSIIFVFILVVISYFIK